MSNMIRLASVTAHSSVDGPGLRTVVWFQGCPHHCVGCHNPETQSVDKGYCVTMDELMLRIESLHNKKITLAGGDPFLQALPLLELVERLESLGYNIWCYTGYTFEECLILPAWNVGFEIGFRADQDRIMTKTLDESLNASTDCIGTNPFQRAGDHEAPGSL